jgi:hypothetical protein
MNTLTQEQARELAKKYDAECNHHSDNRPYPEWTSYEFSLEELTSFANAAVALGVAQERARVVADCQRIMNATGEGWEVRALFGGARAVLEATKARK